jgi:hypothetical protein
MDRDRSVGKSWGRAVLAGLILLAIGLVPAGPFLTSRAVGTSEADNYSLALADAVTQLRAGVLPPLVGQTPYAFNGRIHPLRSAPYLFYLAGALDLATWHRLSFWELQNFSLALSLAGAAFGCYLGLRWGAGCGRGWALALSAAYAWCPALLVAAHAEDLFMTVHAAPFVPLALGACLRQLRRPAARNDLLLAAALAAAWLAHPPVALWTMAAAGILRLAILLRRPSWRALGGLAAAGSLFFVLAGFGFVSGYSVTQHLGLLAAGGAFKEDYARVVFENLRAAFPAVLLPVSRRVSDLGNLQLGYAHWLLLAFALAGLAGTRPSRAAGWDGRRVSALALVAVAGLLLVFCLPIPGLTSALWIHLPAAVHLVTNIWPMQRLYLVATALIVFAAALTPADLLPRGAARILIAAGLGWTLWQAEPFLAHGYALRWSPAQTAASHDESNLDLSPTAYAFFGLPDDFTSGVIDPRLQLRLVSVRNAVVTPEPPAPGLARAPVVQAGVFRRASAADDRLAPALVLQPGKRYLLQLDFLTGPVRVYLTFSGERMDRAYRLPNAGGETGFGMEPGNSRTLGLWTSLDHAETVIARIPAWGDGPHLEDRQLDFARFILREIDPALLPVRLESYLPLRCAVEAPREGLYLETFRDYLPGYAAKVDDRAVRVRRGADGRVLVPVPPGRSEVKLSYVGSPLLLASFWVGVAGWLGFLLWLAASAWPAGAPGLRSAAIRSVRWLARGWIALGVGALALLAVATLWCRARPPVSPVGPLRVRFLLPLDQMGRNQPIVVLGHDGTGTILFLNQTDAAHLRLGVDAWGELHETGPVPIAPDRIQELIVSASALYPPEEPRIRALDPATARRLRGELRVDLNGANVLAVSHPPSPGETADVHLGENRIGGSFAGPRFFGELISSSRLPLPQWLVLAPGQEVDVRLSLPSAAVAGRQPVLGLEGDSRKASVYAVWESPRQVRVGLFSFDGTWDERGDLPLDADGALTLHIRAGRTGAGLLPSGVAIDGLGRHLLGPQRLHPLLGPLRATVGRALSDAASINADFAGAGLSAGIGSTPVPARFGAFDLVVALPKNRAGRAEPLVVSGLPGAADLIYVIYVDSRHVRFGVDHWGQGGAVSGLVPIDYDAAHELEVSLGSFYPAAEDPWWGGTPAAARGERGAHAAVWLDGRQVLDAPVVAYPSESARITVGANRVGGSSCDPEFSGRIIFSGRLPPPGPDPR